MSEIGPGLDADRLLLTAAPDYIEPAWQEFRQAASDPQAEQSWQLSAGGHVGREALAPGILLIHWPGSFLELARRWQVQPPIFVRHIAPVHVALPDPTLPAIQEATESALIAYLDPDLTFSVQTRVVDWGGDAPGAGAGARLRPFEVNEALAAAVRQVWGATLDVRRPQQVLSVLIVDSAGERNAYLGLSLAAHNLSDWAGGERRFQRDAGQISRAEFKLLEALEQFRVELPAGGRALDLGAAPGGWTRVLRERGLSVTAVDPAQLHPALAADAGVRHLRMSAESYLAAGPGRFDLLLNDMRLDGRDSARLMVAFARYLRPAGQAIMTLKLPTDGLESVMRGSLDILRRAYRVSGARQLFHNRQEVTLWLLPLPANDQ
jgi:23S rRNA (cytidine2498-2'-O)-methyltransferase